MTNTCNLTCGHKGSPALFRQTPKQLFYGYTMGSNVYDMLVTCPTCRKLVSLVRPEGNEPVDETGWRVVEPPAVISAFIDPWAAA